MEAYETDLGEGNIFEVREGEVVILGKTCKWMTLEGNMWITGEGDSKVTHQCARIKGNMVSSTKELWDQYPIQI